MQKSSIASETAWIEGLTVGWGTAILAVLRSTGHTEHPEHKEGDNNGKDTPKKE